MVDQMILSYDKEGDVLDISLGKPTNALSKEITDDFFIRVNEQGKIIGFMVLNFEKRFKDKLEEKVPIEAQFMLSKEFSVA